MLNKIKTIFFSCAFLMCSFIYAEDGTLGLGVVTETSAEITMTTTADVGGFQISIEGGEITDASGGLAADAGFTVSFSGATVLGFSLTGGVIPADSEGVLTTLEGTFSDTLCLTGIVMSNATGEALTFTAGDYDCSACDDVDADGICDDVDDCVGEYDECGVCNGDGIADGACDCDGNVEDCAGECGGDAVEDCAGECGGDAVEDCAGECGGDAIVDECGVCEGDGTSCETNDPMIGLGAWDSEANTMEVNVVVGEVALSGFQFGVTGFTISAAGGGLAEDAGFTVSNSSNTVIGFSLTGTTIEANTSGVLTILFVDEVTDLNGCMVDVILSDPNGGAMEWMIGDCIQVGEVVEGCTDELACNYDETANTDDESCEYPEENFDCDGNCTVEEDCLGECGGDAVEDDCGVCNGTGTDLDEDGICDDVDDCVGEYDCAGECNGDAVVDDCDVCEGDNTTCYNVVYFGDITESGSICSDTDLGTETECLENNNVWDEDSSTCSDADLTTEEDCLANNNSWVTANTAELWLSVPDVAPYCSDEQFDNETDCLDVDIDNDGQSDNQWKTGEVAGFQFDVTGLNINDAFSGVEDLGWTVSTNETTLIGFSLTGDVLATNSMHLLTVLEFDYTDVEACISFENDGALADSDGDVMSSIAGDCYEYTLAVAGCTDDSACNYDETANYDDDSCIYAEANYDCEGTFIGSYIQVIHNSASLNGAGGPAVDIYVNGEMALPEFQYRTATSVLELPNSFDIQIHAAGNETQLAEYSFNFTEGSSHVLIATGVLGQTENGFYVTSGATNFDGAGTENDVAINIYHGSTDAPAVDILADANDGSVLVSDLSYSDFTGSLDVPAADYTLGVAPTGGDAIAAFTAALSGLGGGTAVVFASGYLAPVEDQAAFGLFAALTNGTVLELPALSQDCEDVWGGDTFIVCDDGSLVCDESECPVTNALTISYGQVTDSMVEINYDTNADIAGFQFTVSGLLLVSGSGGAAEDAGFTVSVGDTTGIVIGFSFDGSTIPAGAGILTNLSAANPDGNVETCLSDVIISDGDGNPFVDVTIGACADLSPLNISDDMPSEYSLSQNYPNPFNPTTNISFSVVNSGEVTLKIYDLSGKEINELTDNFYTPGTYNIIWDATDFNGNQVSSGIYIYQLKSNDGILSNSMILMR